MIEINIWRRRQQEIEIDREREMKRKKRIAPRHLLILTALDDVHLPQRNINIVYRRIAFKKKKREKVTRERGKGRTGRDRRI